MEEEDEIDFPVLADKPRLKGKVEVFGVIFYDVRHPFVKIVLQDERFWAALDEISGPRWTIYASKGVHGSNGPTVPGVRRALKTYGLERYFDKLPLIALAAESREETTVLVKVARITDSSPEDVFNSLKSLFERIASVLEKVEIQNIDNTFEIFHLLSDEIQNEKELGFFKSLVSHASLLKGFFELMTNRRGA